MYTVDVVQPAENSDALDIIRFKETDYQSVVKRGTIETGQSVMFIPPESVLPFELSEQLEITKYLSKGKVIITKLRGNRSEGLIVEPSIVEPYIPHIYQWEDLPTTQMMGMMVSKVETPPEFEVFYKMPNLRNEPQTFENGESVIYSEKIHGTNCRFGIFTNPSTGEDELYVGSHKTVLRESESNTYWNVVKKTLNGERIPKNTMFYGEIYGRGIQDMNYGVELPTIKIFAMSYKGKYYNPGYVAERCIELSLPYVQFHVTKYDGIEKMKRIAETKSELYDGFKEGIVIVSSKNPNVMGKILCDKYLERKNKTERH
jgi:RNA ligase (TIGR02306 family)